MTPAVRVALRLPPELKQQVGELAAAKHRSVNAQLTRLIEIGLAVTGAATPHEAAQVWNRADEP